MSTENTGQRKFEIVSCSVEHAVGTRAPAEGQVFPHFEFFQTFTSGFITL
jgi:hypothetical protein